MTHLPDHPPEEHLPKSLRDALAELYPERIPVPREVDDMILSSARAGFVRRRRMWLWARRASVAIAAAAVLAVAIRLAIPRTPAGPAAAVMAVRISGDVNHDGRVDILDAFTVAKAVRTGRRLDPAWDVNGDGRVDEKDVEWLAREAVTVDGGKLQ